jgi:hypothetical protein
MRYDNKEFLQLSISAGETLLGVFGYTKNTLNVEILPHGKQIMLP